MLLPFILKVTDDVTYADSKLFRVRINSAYATDKGLLMHEYQHIKQQYAVMLIMLLLAVITYFVGYLSAAVLMAILSVVTKDFLYTFVEPARYWFEVQGYAAQLKQVEEEYGSAAVHDNADVFAKALAEGYKVKATKQQAFADIVKVYLSL